jgi:hypothetical protein
MLTTYEPIATTTLGTAASSITFSSISANYTDLIVICNVLPSTNQSFNLRVGNGSIDTGTNYSYTRLFGSGASASSDRGSNTANSWGSWGVFSQANTPLTFITQIQNYSNTTTNKTYITRIADDFTQYVGAIVSLWRSTSAINTISLVSGANMSIGTIVTLYGVKAG